MTADRDRLRKQRDEVSKQFEDLSRLRNTESEKLFERYKEVSETAGKGQSLQSRSNELPADVRSTERYHRQSDDIEREAGRQNRQLGEIARCGSEECRVCFERGCT